MPWESHELSLDLERTMRLQSGHTILWGHMCLILTIHMGCWVNSNSCAHVCAGVCVPCHKGSVIPQSLSAFLFEGFPIAWNFAELTRPARSRGPPVSTSHLTSAERSVRWCQAQLFAWGLGRKITPSCLQGTLTEPSPQH